jgi:hypothetical protein
MTSKPTEIYIEDYSSPAVRVRVLAVNVKDVLANQKNVNISQPLETDPSAIFYNLRRIVEVFTITGYIDKDSATQSGTPIYDTAREVLFCLRDFIRTKDKLKLYWGTSSATGTPGEEGIMVTGFLDQIELDESPIDELHDKADQWYNASYRVVFTFARGTSLRT